ncbi:hypothetical protein MRX96_037735 [Rhipicephalus microplus]
MNEVAESHVCESGGTAAQRVRRQTALNCFFLSHSIYGPQREERVDCKAATGRMMAESESETNKKAEDGCAESGAVDVLPDYYNARGEKTFYLFNDRCDGRTRAPEELSSPILTSFSPLLPPHCAG